MRARAKHLPQKKHLEIEVKLKIGNLQKARRELKALGFEEEVHRALEENWILDFPAKPLAHSRCLLRLRQFNGKSLVTFKAPSISSAEFKIREELETEVGDAPIFYQILGRLGLVLVFRYQKYRSVFEKGASRKPKTVLSLDETPIGNYLEIEGTKEDIEKVARQLGYSKKDFITESYLGLYLQFKPLARNPEMIFSK